MLRPLPNQSSAAMCAVAIALLTTRVTHAQDAGVTDAAATRLTGDGGTLAPAADASTPSAPTTADRPPAAQPVDVASDQVEIVTPREPLHTERPGVTIWSTLVYPFYFGLNGTLSLTMGTNIPFMRYWSVVVEGTVQLGARRPTYLRAGGMPLTVVDPTTDRAYVDPYFGLRGAIGIAGLYGIRGSLLGPFILPKITFGYRSIDEAHCAPNCTTSGYSVVRRHAAEGDIGIELDAGFQFQARHFYLAIIIGVGVGYCINCIAPEDPMMPPPTPVRGNMFQPQVNFDALRVGFTF